MVSSRLSTATHSFAETTVRLDFCAFERFLQAISVLHIIEQSTIMEILIFCFFSHVHLDTEAKSRRAQQVMKMRLLSKLHYNPSSAN